MSLLDVLPKPLLDDIVCNRSLPVVGAGFSLNAETPPGKTMPLWNTLADILSEELKDYPKSSPIDVISTYVHEFSRAKLIERLHDLLLVDSARPGKAHIAFCNCQFDIVVTTNFDFLLERGFEKVEKYCQPIIEEDQLPIAKRQPYVSLLKLHGDLHHPNRMVITEEDYDLFLDKYPLLSTYLANLLIQRTPLFIGYSLDDPDFRHIWQLVSNRLGQLRRPAYVLTVDARPSDISRFERRGVKVINFNGTKDRYAQILEELFIELREYWAKELLKVSTVVEEESLAYLSIPEDSPGTLCFFSLPFELMSFYRTFVFPLVRNYGLTPITVEDVISPGNSIAAKTTALLSKADIVVIEAQDRRTLYELKELKKMIRKKKVLVVSDDTSYSDSDQVWTVIRRPQKLWESDEYLLNEFLSEIDRWFADISEELRPELEAEPLRLLQKREYRAALISALGLLEIHLRAYYGDKHTPYSMLIKKLLYIDDRIPQKFGRDVHEWIRLRNMAVHGGQEITPGTARRIVRGVMEMIDILQSHILVRKLAASEEDKDHK